MLGTVNLPVFILSGILLNIYPGPDTMYIVARTVSQGRRAGCVSVLGIGSGALVHNCLSALGLSSLLLAYPPAFTAVKAAGAFYLAYLGIRTLLHTGEGQDTGQSYLSGMKGMQIYRQGLLTNLLNPKVALFFLSYLPQFVDPAAGYGFITFIFLGSIFIFTGTLWCFFLVFFAAGAADVIGRKGTLVSLFEKITGIIFILLAANMVFDVI